MQEVFRGLEPERVFWWFDRIAQIPHGSGREQELSDFIYEYFRKLGFSVTQDQHWNLIIRKSATEFCRQECRAPQQRHAAPALACRKKRECGKGYGGG